jgi:type IV pilus assembly protein PilW
MKARGFTLVELMVALVIGSLLALAAASLAISFDASRKSGMSSNTANANGSTSLSTISASVSMAGAGLISNQSQACLLLYSFTPTRTNSGTAFDPLSIDHDSNPNSDIINFAYATGGSASSMMKMPAALASLNSSVTVGAIDSVAVGDDVFFAYDAGSNYACTLRTVSSMVAGLSTNVLNFDATATNHNGDVGATPTYDTTSYLIPLGTLKYQSWYAENGTLKLADLLTGNVGIVADGVVYLRAQYGMDSGTGVTWQDVALGQPTLNAAQLSALKSLRTALVVRSPDREKQADAANCVTTTNASVSLGSGWNSSVDVSGLLNTAGTALIPDWRCYHYRVYNTITPLRNFFWAMAQ